jgi:hypothetical protein
MPGAWERPGRPLQTSRRNEHRTQDRGRPPPDCRGDAQALARLAGSSDPKSVSPEEVVALRPLKSQVRERLSRVLWRHIARASGGLTKDRKGPDVGLAADGGCVMPVCELWAGSCRSGPYDETRAVSKHFCDAAVDAREVLSVRAMIVATGTSAAAAAGGGQSTSGWSSCGHRSDGRRLHWQCASVSARRVRPFVREFLRAVVASAPWGLTKRARFSEGLGPCWLWSG